MTFKDLPEDIQRAAGSTLQTALRDATLDDDGAQAKKLARNISAAFVELFSGNFVHVALSEKPHHAVVANDRIDTTDNEIRLTSYINAGLTYLSDIQHEAEQGVGFKRDLTLSRQQICTLKKLLTGSGECAQRQCTQLHIHQPHL